MIRFKLVTYAKLTLLLYKIILYKFSHNLYMYYINYVGFKLLTKHLRLRHIDPLMQHNKVGGYYQVNEVLHVKIL